MVIVLMIVREARFHRRKVLSCWMPREGLRIDTGTTKSEVSMIFLFQSTVRPCGLNGSSTTLRVPATSVTAGNSLMIL